MNSRNYNCNVLSIMFSSAINKLSTSTEHLAEFLFIYMIFVEISKRLNQELVCVHEIRRNYKKSYQLKPLYGSTCTSFLKRP